MELRDVCPTGRHALDVEVYARLECQDLPVDYDFIIQFCWKKVGFTDYDITVVLMKYAFSY